MIHRRFKTVVIVCVAVAIGLLAQASALAQEKPPQASKAPVVNSPEVLPDGRIVFRILAPKAESVGLQASDIPSLARGGPKFAKGENGVWEAIVGPIEPGAYRCLFMVNGVSVVDPRNPAGATPG